MNQPSKPATLPASYIRLASFFHAGLFVLGFSAVFIIGWGGAASLVGQVLGFYKIWIGRIGGVAIIIMGLSTLGLIRLPWMYYADTRRQWTSGRGGGVLSSVMMGVFFAAGWTPCIGNTLAAILTLSLSQNTTGQAMLLTSGYALGLGIPFLLLGVMLDRAVRVVQRLRRHLRKIEIFSGLLLIGMGLLLLTDQLTLISAWAQRNGLYLDVRLAGADAPTYFIAIIAGLLSFLSPCVLPLVPAYLGYLSGRAVEQLAAR